MVRVLDPLVVRCPQRNEECTAQCLNDEHLNKARESYEKGGLFVYPTDTLYALGANPRDERAVEQLFQVKNRPMAMPISVAVPDMDTMKEIAYVTEVAEILYERFLPGPLTLLLEKREALPDIVTAGEKRIGIRIPNHPLALKLVEELGPITATSANLHGHPDPKDIDMAIGQLGERVALYLDCGPCTLQAPSTIADASGSGVKIIREGVISREEIKAVILGGHE